MSDSQRKPIHFVGSTIKDLRGLPIAVRGAFGRQLLDVQYGDRPAGAQTLKGFGGAGIVELVEDDASGTYRAVFTLQFAEAVYVLHVFQKKSKRGIGTPKADIELIKWRLRQAARHYAEHYHGREERDA